MGAFNTKTILSGTPSLIPAIADRICQTFAAEGYEISRDNLMSGGVDISVTKGGVFKAIVGMKTALKITLIPQNNSISFEAGVGIFGQQALPTIISMLFFWPVILTQIWGLVKQSKLDDRALIISQSVIANSFESTQFNINDDFQYCTNCGANAPITSKYCSHCGAKIK